MPIVIDQSENNGWASAWPDALAFLAGLALAWFGGWDTKDLVWSLWLSSLMVGYAMIVWNIFGPGSTLLQQARDNGAGSDAQSAVGGLYIVSGLFLLGFFTLHFGVFHFVHSMFLNAFFPITEGGPHRFPGPSLYWHVFKDYWPFVLVTAMAERQAFRVSTPVPTASPDTSVTVEAIAARKAKSAVGDTMMTPYKNVIRLHLLIFFFAFASFAKLQSFWVYAVVYAVYFFPWRLLQKEKKAV